MPSVVETANNAFLKALWLKNKFKKLLGDVKIFFYLNQRIFLER